MSIHTLLTRASVEPLAEIKAQLAAAYRLATLHSLDEAINNHFTVVVPGRSDEYLILPFGWHWSEACASAMIIFNEAGETLHGEGQVEITARCIHAPIHRITGAKVVLHTHQTWATALNMLQDNRLLAASQIAALLQSQIAYDDDYEGVANALSEGERLASLIEGKSILFMKNHGVLVTGDTVGEAYQRLYYLERVCRNQMIALATGKPLQIIPAQIVETVAMPAADDPHTPALRAKLFFDAMMRVAQRELPGYAD